MNESTMHFQLSGMRNTVGALKAENAVLKAERDRYKTALEHYAPICDKCRHTQSTHFYGGCTAISPTACGCIRFKNVATEALAAGKEGKE